MDLYNTIFEFLKANNGKAKLQDIQMTLKKDYSKAAVLELIKDYDTAFHLENEYVSSYQVKIEVFLHNLKSSIYRKKPNPENVKYIVLDNWLSYLKKGRILKKYVPDYSENQNDRDFDYDLEFELEWDGEFKSTPEKLYQFNYRLFEFLIEQEQINYGIFSTPQTIIELFRKLMPGKHELEIYNPAAGFLNLATGLKVFSGSNLKFKASEIIQSSYYLGQVFSAIHDVDVDFACTDSGEEVMGLKNLSFDFIVSNLPFAVKNRENQLKNRKYKEFSMHIISESLHKLKDSGRAVFLVNDGILFSGQKEAIVFRKEIITSGFLNCVISLPAGIMPQSGVKASLLVFEKGKPKDHVQLINAAEKEFYSLRPDKSVSLDTNKIISWITWEESGTSKYEAHEPEAEYASGKAKLNVSVNEFQENGFELSAGRYIADKKQYLGEDYITLKDVCQLYKAGKVEKKGVFPYIRITELNGQTLSEINSSYFNNTQSPGKLVSNPAFLIGTIKGSYKPTWFSGNKTIEVSGNIAVLGFDKKKVFPLYLVQELNAAYVTNQFDLLAKGSAINSITREDLLSVKVKLPVIEEQKRIYNERIDFGKEHQLTINQDKNTVSDVDLISVARHEIGNILGGHSGFLDLLPEFLTQNNIDLNTPFVVNQPETIQEMIQSSVSQINQIHWLMENLKGIILSDSKSFNPVKTELRTFMEECLKDEILKNEMNWYVTINGSYHSNEKNFAEIDTGQFKLIVRNMVLNALNHGKADTPLNFVVDIMNFEELDPSYRYIAIDFINDGNPLPVDFKLEDYVSFGVKTGNSRGQGLGGFIVNRVVENHSGMFELIPPGLNREVEPDKIVKSNVNFSITIPINQ